MSENLDVRLEDGNVATIVGALVAGQAVQGQSLTATAAVVDTGIAPPPGEGMAVLITANASDPATPADAAGSALVSLKRTAAGVTTVAGSQALGAAAFVGTAGLVAAAAMTFTISANNTLVLNLATAGYAPPVNWGVTLATGAVS